MDALVALTDPPARDPAIVGHKAAGLAAASAAGLPILPGAVLPLDASAPAILAGAAALERSGPPAAILEASRAPVSVPDRRAVDAVGRGGPVVVRSSTALDRDGRWSGAFASYLDVVAGDLPAAVRGCWASVFSRDVIARCEGTDVEVGSLRVAVLIQPFGVFRVGGTAVLRPDGAVLVTAAADGPLGVVSGGRRAVEVVVEGDDRITGHLGTVPAGVVRAAASLARRAASAIAPGAIEWGAVGDEVLLLQVGPAAPDRAAAVRPAAIPPGSPDVPVDAERLARLVTMFPGPVGEDLVLPWAFGLPEPPRWRPIGVHDPATALAEASAVADDLAAAAWSAPSQTARARARAVAASLRAGRIVEALRELRGARPVDHVAAARVPGLIDGIGAALVERGALPAASLVWRIPPDRWAGDRSSEPGVVPRGPDRWEPFVAEVVFCRGATSTGIPAADGIGAGLLHEVRHLRDIGRPGPRGVLWTPLPLPQLAPLLWHAAALVTAAGSTGAHLFEVARSLGIPAVAGVDLVDVAEAGTLVAVDGSAGRVSALVPAPSPLHAVVAPANGAGSPAAV